MPYKVTTFRIKPDQWRWLRKKALTRASLGNGTRIDASELVREMIEDQRAEDEYIRVGRVRGRCRRCNASWMDGHKEASG